MRIHSELAGFFKLEKGKCDADGNPIEATREVVADWFPNLILDQGLDMIGAAGNSYMGMCFVGTSNTTPSNSQTALVAQVASTATVVGNTTSNSGSPLYYNVRQRTYRFDEGAAAGNLSEVGIGPATGGEWTAGELFSRALILDGDGNPTTITVLADEFLDVTYELRAYQSLTDSTGTITIAGVDYDWTQRAISVSGVRPPGDPINTAAFSFGLTVWSGGLGAITDTNPAGSGEAGTSTVASYTLGNYYRDVTGVWTLSPNYPVNTLRAELFHLPGVFQIEFDPVIPMDNTKRLTLVVRASWTRKTLP